MINCKTNKSIDVFRLAKSNHSIYLSLTTFINDFLGDISSNIRNDYGTACEPYGVIKTETL